MAPPQRSPHRWKSPRHPYSRSRSYLELLFRDPDAQSVQLVGNLDLAGQSARIADVKGEIEHVLFHLAARAGLRHPFRLDIDVAGRAGARSTAVGVDPRNHVLDRGLHHRHAVLAFDCLLSAVML